MKKLILVVAMSMVLLVFFPSCKTAEFVWNPVGMWALIISGDWGETWTEMLNLTGSESAGTVSGWEYLNPALKSGTWSRTGFSLTINLDFVNGDYRNVLTFSSTSTEANPNSMAGSGSWIEYWFGSYNDTYGMTFTATKTTNLQ